MEQKAIKMIIETLNLGEEESKEITINTCRNGRNVAWYVDGYKEMCVYIDTLEELSMREINKELM